MSFGRRAGREDPARQEGGEEQVAEAERDVPAASWPRSRTARRVHEAGEQREQDGVDHGDGSGAARGAGRLRRTAWTSASVTSAPPTTATTASAIDPPG